MALDHMHKAGKTDVSNLAEGLCWLKLWKSLCIPEQGSASGGGN